MKRKILSMLLAVVMICGLSAMTETNIAATNGIVAMSGLEPAVNPHFAGTVHYSGAPDDLYYGISLYFNTPQNLASGGQRFDWELVNSDGSRVFASNQAVPLTTPNERQVFSQLEHTFLHQAVFYDATYPIGTNAYTARVWTWDDTHNNFGENYPIPGTAIKSQDITLNLTVNPALSVTAEFAGMQGTDYKIVLKGPTFSTGRDVTYFYTRAGMRGNETGTVASVTANELVILIPSTGVNSVPGTEELFDASQVTLYPIEVKGRSVAGNSQSANMTITNVAGVSITDGSIAPQAPSDNITVLVNGTAVIFDQPPIIENGRTLVPLRAIFEALGAKVDWNQSTQTVTAIRGDTTVTLTIGSNTLNRNGEQVTLDVPAQLVGGRTLVPARAVAESFGAKVEWDAGTRTVTITE
jgi:hypothetical protein